jgi:tRNA threonylcarbamoyladenosine biosynthesis protein TsaB
MRRGHAEALMPMISDIMDEAGIGFADLQAVAVTVGPGAFTGIRIGLSAARGMALAANLPVVGVTTLEAVAAAQADAGRPLLVALDSKREDIYAQLFAADGTAIDEPRSILPAEAGMILPPDQEVAVAGDMADAVLHALQGRQPPLIRLAGFDLPDAAVVAEIAARRLPQESLAQDKAPPSALYLRPPDAVPLAARKTSANR